VLLAFFTDRDRREQEEEPDLGLMSP